MIKEVTHAHLGPIWYHSESSNVPHSKKQFLGWDFFFRFFQQDGSKKRIGIQMQFQKGSGLIVSIGVGNAPFNNSTATIIHVVR